MNFFSKLVETGINDVIIQMKQDGQGNITVFITPKSCAEDLALKSMKPIYVTGTPEEIDQEFFAIISEPLVETQKVFSNIQAYEAQRDEAKKEADAKATKEKEAKAAKLKAIPKAKEDGEEDSDENAPAKVVKVNNWQVLKDFHTSIKGQPILDHEVKLEELLLNLSEVELDKPLPKKIRIDLDIAIRKRDQIAAAKAKFAATTLPLTVEEEVAPNVETIGAVEELSITTENDLPKEETEVVEQTEPMFELSDKAIAEMSNDFSEEEVVESIEELVDYKPITTKEDFLKSKALDIEVSAEIISKEEEEVILDIPLIAPPKPAPMMPPAPVEAIKKFKEVETLVMIAQDYTYEMYINAGWTDEVLIQHGKAVMEKTMVEVIEEEISGPPSLKYEFPKPFDAE